MLLFDTHVHVEGTDMAAMFARAREAGVGRILAVGGSEDANAAALRAARDYPDTVRSAVGFDREQVRAGLSDSDRRDAALSGVRSIARESGGGIVAVGEIGLDFHYGKDTEEAQKELFNAQLALARELQLPVIVHSREAEDATLALLREHVEAWGGEPERIGVPHCFSGNRQFAEKLIALEFYISFSGLITFKNAAGLKEVVLAVPDDKLLIETDTPYLAPVPYRGRENEPAYLKYVAEAVAGIKGVPVEDVASLTTANANRLFDIS